MPLVIICGYPSSGKTTLALQLKSFLEAKLLSHPQQLNFKNVQLVNEESLNIPANDYYMSKFTDKYIKPPTISYSFHHAAF